MGPRQRLLGGSVDGLDWNHLIMDTNISPSRDVSMSPRLSFNGHRSLRQFGMLNCFDVGRGGIFGPHVSGGSYLNTA